MSQESGGSEAEATADAKLQVLTFHSELGWFLIIKKKKSKLKLSPQFFKPEL